MKSALPCRSVKIAHQPRCGRMHDLRAVIAYTRPIRGGDSGKDGPWRRHRLLSPLRRPTQSSSIHGSRSSPQWHRKRLTA